MKKLLIISPIVLLAGTAIYAQDNSGSFYLNGHLRSYQVYLPNNYNINDDYPLVFYLNGYDMTARVEVGYFNLNLVADTSEYILVTPNPIDLRWNSGVGENLSYPTPDVNDVGFISALIDTLNNHYSIDLERIYTCGFSNGGFMSYKLACQLSHRIAAIASVGGVISSGTAENCNPVHAMPVLHIHGTKDTWVPQHGFTGWYSVDQTLNYWTDFNDCAQVDTILLPDLDPEDGCTVQKISYTDCSEESSMIFDKVINGGHTWPGAVTYASWLGTTNQDVNAGVEILNFFKQFENPMADMAFIQTIEVPPLCYEFTGDSIPIRAELINPSNHLAEVFAYIRGQNSESLDNLQLFDDGMHGDGVSDDNIWGARWLPPVIDEMYKISLTSEDKTYGIIQDYFRKDTFSIQSAVPEITVRVEDFHTGEPLHGSKLTYGSNIFLSNEDGEIYIQDCIGEYTFLISLDEYSKVVRTFDVYSDTTFVITLVRDSYLKVMDRSTGDPVNGARVFYGDGGYFTDDEGIAIIQDYREERFSYRVEHDTYFTLEDSVTFVPGDTLSIPLTRLVANIDFYVTNEAGPMYNQAIKMSGLSKKTESDGHAFYLNIPARKVYQYSVERNCYLPVIDSLFLEIDTAVHIVLVPDTIIPVLQVDMIGDTLIQISCSKSGMIYVVPTGTHKHPDSIRAAQIISVPISSGQLLEIPTAGLPDGDYSIYVIDGCQNISDQFMTDVEDNVASGISIYPNPVREMLIVEVDVSTQGTLVITSISGQVMHRSTIHDPHQEIDFSSFQKGLYFITIRSEEFIATQKIIKF